MNWRSMLRYYGQAAGEIALVIIAAALLYSVAYVITYRRLPW